MILTIPQISFSLLRFKNLNFLTTPIYDKLQAKRQPRPTRNSKDSLFTKKKKKKGGRAANFI